MAHSHSTGPDRDRHRELMDSNILYRNVRTSLKQGHKPDLLSPIMPVPFPVPVPVPSSVNEPLFTLHGNRTGKGTGNRTESNRS